MKLLIVDDHVETRSIIRSYLNPLASEVAECGDSQAAIDLCRQFEPDVMTLDMRLGNEDGIAILEFVRAHFPDIYIVVVTQFREQAIAELVVRMGAAGCFSKSHLIELRTHLERHLAGAEESS